MGDSKEGRKGEGERKNEENEERQGGEVEGLHA